jgi:hypothetical protein
VVKLLYCEHELMVSNLLNCFLKIWSLLDFIKPQLKFGSFSCIKIVTSIIIQVFEVEVVNMHIVSA